MKEIYLITRKFNGEVIKSALEDANDALDEFNTAYRTAQKTGYKCTSNSLANDECFVKVAKCTKGDDVIKMRLESIPYRPKGSKG